MFASIYYTSIYYTIDTSKRKNTTASFVTWMAICSNNSALEISARPLAQASAEKCQASTNHGTLARFGKYALEYVIF